MPKIHSLKISNYRGIKKFDQRFGCTDFVCIIGRGDSGKTTILEAISVVLSPSWNLTFYDTDFFNGDISEPIEIEVSLYDIPKSLLQESKYGLYIRGLDKSTWDLHDDIQDDHEIILTVKLIVDKDLEPKWFVINDRNQENIEIKSGDRAKLNVFLISDYIDRHFSWNKGNPLYSLLKQGNDILEEKENVVIDAFRLAKESIDSSAFNHLDAVTEKIKSSALSIGIDITNTKTTIDFKDISIKDGRVCLHDDKIPFRLKGKGSKRLISIAIQKTLVESDGIMLIDEIEQGLEPDRVQHLVNTLKRLSSGQVFITTHSRDVLVELESHNIYLMKKAAPNLIKFDESYQACLRKNPEAFFAKKIIVCEGATEVGICRAINDFRISKGQASHASLGIRLADGTGANYVKYCKDFSKAGFSVCAFCDSDDTDINEKKTELTECGVKIVDCELGNAIEQQLFDDLPVGGVKELLDYAIEEKSEESIKTSIKNQNNNALSDNWYENDIETMRMAIGKASILSTKAWFKRTDHGEFLGTIWCKYLDQMEGKRLTEQFNDLNEWIDNA